ncbi:MAG: exonuclease SbcCD subunit D [Candidatus Thorarchaeota archaeon]
MPVRIAHISDTHLGARPRQGVKHNVWGVEMRSRLLENDFYERFVELFHRIAELDPPVDIVVHSGDLYDSPWEYNPSQPPVVAQETAISVLKKFIEETDIPVVIIEGNHGLYRSLEVSLLDSLKMAVPGLYVATQVDLKRALASNEPLMYSFDKLDVFCFPFIDYEVLESTNQVANFNDWISECQVPKPKKVSIGVAHGMEIDRSLHTTIFEMDYDYVALGHDHHQHKHSSNRWYAGSPERWRFDESRYDKGFLIVELEHGETPEVTPVKLEFTRPVYNEKILVDPDDTEDTVVEKAEAIFHEKGLVTSWDSVSAARVRLMIEGQATRLSAFGLTVAMETLRSKIHSPDSEYNIAQLVWTIRQPDAEYVTPAYPEIESEYLIENPESDFRAYLETLDVDERFDEGTLTKIAVKALKLSVSRTDERLTLETLSEGEE